MQRHILRIAVVTVLTFALQAAYSPMVQALQQMRAANCCAENCKHTQAFTSASRCGCCQISAVPDAASAATNGKPDLSGPDTASIASVDFASLSGVAPAVKATSAASPRAAPVFLLTLSIRL